MGADRSARSGIDIEKLVNGEDADTPEDAIEIVPGEHRHVHLPGHQHGQRRLCFDDVDVTDDNGTPGDLSDDVSTTSGEIIFDPSSDVGSDLILSPAKRGLYVYTTTAADLYPSGRLRL